MHGTLDGGAAVVLSGFPLPMVKPLVPSGILGPLLACFIGDSHCPPEEEELLHCGDDARRPRPPWIWVRSLVFPRPFPHPFFAAPPPELSSTYVRTHIYNYQPPASHELCFTRLLIVVLLTLLVSVDSDWWWSGEVTESSGADSRCGAWSSSSRHPSNSDFLPFNTDLGCKKVTYRIIYRQKDLVMKRHESINPSR